MLSSNSVLGQRVSPPPLKRRKISVTEQSAKLSDESLITIWCWNVNGISPLIQRQRAITLFFGTNSNGRASPDVPTNLRAVLRRYEWPSLFFLQEVKINPDDSATQRAIERAVQPDIDDAPEAPVYTVHFCLPKDKYNARGFGRKVYGVCSLIRKDFFDSYVERVREVDWDLEGRFLVCETKAVGTVPKLAIFNVYAVNGTDAPFKDSATGEIAGTRHDRKLEVHRLLQQECRTLEGQGYGVVLAGDLNVARTPLDGHPNLRTVPQQHCANRADFERKFFMGESPAKDSGQDSLSGQSTASERVRGLGMIDTYRHLWPEAPGYTYYPPSKQFGSSCDRVDMIIISRSLEATLVEAGMRETPADRGSSDHVPLFASLRFGDPDSVGVEETQAQIVEGS